MLLAARRFIKTAQKFVKGMIYTSGGPMICTIKTSEAVFFKADLVKDSCLR